MHAELTEPTPDQSDAEAVTAVLTGLIERLRERAGRVGDCTVEANGLGAAGIVEWPSGRVVWARHRSRWIVPQ